MHTQFVALVFYTYQNFMQNIQILLANFFHSPLENHFFHLMCSDFVFRKRERKTDRHKQNERKRESRADRQA